MMGYWGGWWWLMMMTFLNADIKDGGTVSVLLIMVVHSGDGGIVDEIYCEINTTPSKFDIT